MKLIKTKKQSQIPTFDGVDIEYTYIDNSVTEIKLSQGDKFVIISRKDCYSAGLDIIIPEPVKTELRYVVTGTHRDGEIRSRVFMQDYDAEYYVTQLNEAGFTTLLEQTEVVLED